MLKQEKVGCLFCRPVTYGIKAPIY